MDLSQYNKREAPSGFFLRSFGVVVVDSSHINTQQPKKTEGDGTTCQSVVMTCRGRSIFGRRPALPREGSE